MAKSRAAAGVALVAAWLLATVAVLLFVENGEVWLRWLVKRTRCDKRKRPMASPRNTLQQNVVGHVELDIPGSGNWRTDNEEVPCELDDNCGYGACCMLRSGGRKERGGEKKAGCKDKIDGGG
eukprot:1852478-Rhodomonas_salina.1